MNLLFDRLLEYTPGLDQTPQAVARALTLVGVAVERVVTTEHGTVLETEVTTNRPDLLSYLGTAREIALRFGLALRWPETAPLEHEEESAGAGSATLEAASECPRYSARVVRDVRIADSPAWLRRVLEASGIRAVNNVVDVTNFVLLELGHPTHAFDLDRLEGRRVVVRLAHPGEELRTLDGVQRKLDGEELVIADARRPVALAGILGGAGTEISAGTRDVLIESAYFDPRGVRRTARRHGLRTEASVRFERGADPESTALAADRVARLLTEVASGRCLRGLIDVMPRKLAAIRPRLRLGRLEAILGAAVPEPEARRILHGLGFRTQPLEAGVLEVEVPGHRREVEREIDLIEEVGRHHGYDRIPAALPRLDRPPGGRTPAQERERLVREALAGAGWSETMTLSMVDPELERHLTPPGVVPVAIVNPLSDRLAVLRTRLLGGLLEAAALNLRRGADSIQLFEIARVFAVAAGDPRPREQRSLGLVAAGTVPGSSPGRGFDELDLKGILELIARVLRVGEIAVVGADFPAAAATVLGAGRDLGELRLVSPELLEAHGIDRTRSLVAAEVDLQPLLDANPGPPRYQRLARHPASTRDISMYVQGATYGDVLATLRSRPEPLLESVHLIDRYVAQGRTSLTLRLTYRHRERTLDAEEVQAAHARLLEALGRDGRFALRLG